MLRSRISSPFIASAALALAGCATMADLAGGKTADGSATGALPAQPPPATPTARAYQVGVTSARAAKCGFNFDPAKLRTNYLAAEQQAGATPETLPKIEQTYDKSLDVMAKVVAKEEGYCSEEKTKYIKADLTRHLAGDYNPGPPHPKRQDEEGLLSFGEGGLFGSGDPGGGDELMKKQRDAMTY